MDSIIQVSLLLFIPYFAYKLNNLAVFKQWLSPVVIAYVVGIIFANAPIITLDESISKLGTEITLLLALPMLLFSSNILKLIENGKSSLFAFFLAILSAIIGVVLTGWYFHDSISDTWRLSGMLVGIYTGGIPNMQVIGKALEAPEETIILINAADVFLGGIYLLLLSSVVYPFLKWFLPPSELEAEEINEFQDTNVRKWSLKEIGLPLVISAIVVGISVGLTLLVFGELKGKDQWILLLLTSLSLVIPFIPKIKNLNRSYEIGDYFLLAFCVALGLQADFSVLLAQGTDLISFSAVALFGTILLHLILSKLFRIDRDAFMVSTTAAIFGPVFIGQISAVIGKKSLVLTGISLGLLGYAIGNYIGIGLARLLFSMGL